jgi:hypothetical protein
VSPVCYWDDVVCLPRVVGSCSFTTDVADRCCCSDDCGSSTVGCPVINAWACLFALRCLSCVLGSAVGGVALWAACVVGWCAALNAGLSHMTAC